MGYLVCKKCRGYYKLQTNESPTDFTNTCACGGELRYAINIDIVESNKKVTTKENRKYKQNQTSFTNYKSNRYKHESKQSID